MQTMHKSGPTKMCTIWNHKFNRNSSMVGYCKAQKVKNYGQMYKVSYRADVKFL